MDPADSVSICPKGRSQSPTSGILKGLRTSMKCLPFEITDHAILWLAFKSPLKPKRFAMESYGESADVCESHAKSLL